MTVVVYDSNYGNTKIIAETIAKELTAKVIFVEDVTKDILDNIEMLIVGSPINGWQPTKRISKFLYTYAPQLGHIKAAAFDTRVKLFIHGDAAKKISRILKNAGANVIVDPGTFFVKGTEGPLLEGEITRAKEWAHTIYKNSRI